MYLRDLRRECDELRLEVALGCPLDEFRRREGLVEPEPGGPTDAELRRKAAELGLPVPPARRPADPDWHRRYLLAPIPETREAA